MHLLLLGIGAIIGVYGLYRFLRSADIKAIKALFLTVLLLVLAGSLLYLALTGRLPATIGIVAAIAPFIYRWIALRQKGATGDGNPSGRSQNGQMSEEEALSVLNLKKGASREEIKSAYKNLMKKNHPDQDGSAYLAQKLNQAKDRLLK